jgi:hypothetical protein
VPTAVDEAALLASARVATDPIVRLFDLQASVADAAIVAGTARRTARGGSGGVSGCEQLDCALFGTLEVCCFETAFIQTFDTCTFDHGGGRSSVTGQYVIDSDAPGLCSGAIPLRASFVVVVDSFTHDLSFPDGSFSHTFQQLSESYEIAPDDCTVSEPDLFGFGIRGSGRRFINGALQRSRIDGSGHLLVDIESDADALQIAVGATEGPDGCSATATLNGALTAADFRVGTQFTTDFTDFHAIQHPQDGALFLGLNGTVGTDCLGDVTLSTGDPLRIARGDSCFTSGRLEAHVADGTVSGTYTGSGGLDLDFGADGSVDRHFATCADVPADRCSTNQVGLCAACTALSDCHRGLPCFSCSANCSGDTRRCAPATTFVTCEDGVF